MAPTTLPTRFRTGDNRLVAVDEYLAYLETCASLWETRERSPGEAARVRSLADDIRRRARAS